MTDDGKEKKLNIDFEPFKPVNTSLYLCDNKFHTEALNELLESDNKYGFIVMDGNGTLFGTLCGNTREVGRAVMHTCSSWGGVEGRLVLSAFVFFFSLSLSLSPLSRFCTNSLSTCPRSTGVVVSLRSVSRVFVWKSVTITSEKRPSCQCSSSLRTTARTLRG